MNNVSIFQQIPYYRTPVSCHSINNMDWRACIQTLLNWVRWKKVDRWDTIQPASLQATVQAKVYTSHSHKPQPSRSKMNNFPHYILYVHVQCVSKTIHFTFDHNFNKRRPIYKVLSLSDSWRNSVHVCYQYCLPHPKYNCTLPCALENYNCCWFQRPIARDLRIYLASYNAALTAQVWILWL